MSHDRGSSDWERPSIEVNLVRSFWAVFVLNSPSSPLVSRGFSLAFLELRIG